MVENDVQLIHRILSDDDEAFSILVQKYQKSVHALAWRKVNDFHYAEEITQDTFLQAYKKLSTLKNPNQFAGWLYVIANRLCINWLNRHKPAMQSLEDTPMEEIEESDYNHHAAEQREAEGTTYRYEIAQKLLSKLPESERTVMTLYYLGEMTAKEISKFLGVSVNTITSRLRRARERLQQDQERLVQEVLGGVQLSTNLTENIMRQVADVKPIPPPVAKPLLPWGAFGIASLLIALLLGVAGEYLVRFQRPYSFEAVSEPTVEIVDTFIVLDVDSKPDVRLKFIIHPFFSYYAPFPSVKCVFNNGGI
jgi:RNA polymerase sigma factor (sigma-70 family)